MSAATAKVTARCRMSALAKEAAAVLPADPTDAEGMAGFVGRVDQLRDAIEEAVERGDEALGFLGRTKAAGGARRDVARPPGREEDGRRKEDMEKAGGG
uniref:Uncharacterized protein n=1 Tax=Oryza glumipatula TaxID=40148 RepID=A0A0E0BIZ5_9ORYZ